ncbi:MAG: hypothetical protein Tsb0019_31080 [Roseibium sp.]
MLVLPSIKVRRNDRSGRPRAWNDPERALYPHHAEFWPEQLPEHVFLERWQRERKRRVRAFLFQRFLRRLLAGLRLCRLKDAKASVERGTDPCAEVRPSGLRETRGEQEPARSLNCHPRESGDPVTS